MRETARLQKFLSKVRESASGCWEWTASKAHGYGAFWTGERVELAHRYSYEKFCGPLSGFICHSCDNPICVRPDHLFQGTHQENMHDMHKKGRGARGLKHYLGKLSDNDRILIRELKSAGLSNRKIGRMFKVNEATVRYSLVRLEW